MPKKKRQPKRNRSGSVIVSRKSKPKKAAQAKATLKERLARAKKLEASDAGKPAFKVSRRRALTGIAETAVGQPIYFDKCEDILPRPQMCNSIRFTQMLLLKPVKLKTAPEPKTKKRDIIPAGFLILQPRAVSLGSMKPPTKEAIQQRVARFRQKIERSMPITSDVVAGRLPDPRQGHKAVNEMRAALLAHGGTYGDLRTDEKVVRAYASFIRTSMRGEARPISLVLSRAGSGSIFDIGRILDDVEDAVRNILDPAASQPIDHPQPHIALCAVFEQRWCHLGYTRGERVATIALAPGEEMTVEVHSWIKETVKSERELVVESETRLSNKLTTRDHFEVANELSTKGHFGADSKIDLTIPVEGIPIGIGTKTDISGDLSNMLRTTMQRTTEQTTEAANTLRSTRKVRIEEARETGRDDKQLRKVVNTNRCHTLNVHYFEVVANYEVSLRLVEFRPCLLLPVNRPTVTPEWVLCHAHVLKNVLLDKLYLSGFDGAKTLEMQERLEELEEESPSTSPGAGSGAGAGAGGGTGIEVEMSRLRDDILAAFRLLEDTFDDNEDALDDLANINLAQFPWDLAADVAEAIGTLAGSIPRLIYWGLLEVNADALNALKNLENSTNRPALESLRNFFAAVTPRDYQYNIVAATIAEALDTLGIPEGIVNVIITGGLIDLIADDRGLYVAVKAAHERLQAVEQQAALTTAAEAAGETFSQAASSPEFTTELDGFTRLQLAEAKVEFERLKCHILKNCDHYFHAVWELELGCQSLGKPQGYEGLVSPTPIGFVGKKAAFSLLDPELLKTYFDPASIRNAAKDLENFKQKPMTITLPTPSPIAEVTLGQCCGCDDFIMKHRDLDVAVRTAEVKRMEAEAAQAEFEAKRFEERIKAGELADPTPFERADRIKVSVDAENPNP
jgi:hypothetical protein